MTQSILVRNEPKKGDIMRLRIIAAAVICFLLVGCVPPSNEQVETTGPTVDVEIEGTEGNWKDSETLSTLSTEPSEETMEPSEETTEPSEETTEPSEETTQPTKEATEPSEEPTEPTKDVGYNELPEDRS